MSDSAIPYPNGSLYITAGTVLPIVATAVTAARFAIRHHKRLGLLIDDWLVLPSLAGLWAMSICIILGWSRRLFGFTSPPSPEPDDPTFQVNGLLPGQAYLQKLEYIFFIFVILTFGFIKLTVICFYRRVFVVGRSLFHKITIGAIVVTVVWTLVFLLFQIFKCGARVTPYFGPLSEQTSACFDGLRFLTSLAATDLATDLFIFLMPIPLVWSLHMPARKKLAVTLVLCLGAVSIAAAAIRLSIHVGQIVAGYAKKVDLFPTIALPLYFSQLEAGIAVIAINLPVLQHPLRGKSLQSVVASVRSVLSLHSIASSGRSNGETLPRDRRESATNQERSESVLLEHIKVKGSGDKYAPSY